MPEDIVIEVSERLMDYWIDHVGQRHPTYRAQIKGAHSHWAAGQSPDEAVGDLVRSHPERFGVKIEWLGKLPR